MDSKNIIRFDWAIKRLLRQKANFVILEGFLSELLHEDITIFEILESESNQDSGNEKYNRVDILVKNTKGQLIIIEIQNNYEPDYIFRMFYGVCKTVSQSLNLGDKYHQIKKIYFINIVYFDISFADDYIYHGTSEFVGVNSKSNLCLSALDQHRFNKKYPREVLPEYYIINVNKFDDKAKNTLDEWIYFFKNSSIKSGFKAKGLNEAVKTLSELQMTEQERKQYERFIETDVVFNSIVDNANRDGKIEGRLEGKIEGRLEGKVEGRLEGKIEVILNAHHKGLSIDLISEITSLSKEEIAKIIIENK